MGPKQRIALLGISLLAVLGSGLMLATGATGTHWAVIFRAGLALGAIWLALPQLARVRWKSAGPILFAAAVLVVTLAARPRLFPQVALACLAGLLINWAVHMIISILRSPRAGRF